MEMRITDAHMHTHIQKLN